MYNMYSILTKGSGCRKKQKFEIFIDLNRAGHDKSVKKIGILAQIFTKLWPIYELQNYIILIIINSIINNIINLHNYQKQLFIV